MDSLTHSRLAVEVRLLSSLVGLRQIKSALPSPLRSVPPIKSQLNGAPPRRLIALILGVITGWIGLVLSVVVSMYHAGSGAFVIFDFNYAEILADQRPVESAADGSHVSGSLPCDLRIGTALPWVSLA